MIVWVPFAYMIMVSQDCLIARAVSLQDVWYVHGGECFTNTSLSVFRVLLELSNHLHRKSLELDASDIDAGKGSFKPWFHPLGGVGRVRRRGVMYVHRFGFIDV